jgi:hypothetical protein
MITWRTTISDLKERQLNMDRVERGFATRHFPFSFSSERRKEMKGYYTHGDFWGWVEDHYERFESEGAYEEYMEGS